GWSVLTSRFKKPFDGRAKVQQGPRNDSDGACGRNDEGCPLTSRAKGKTQRSERAQGVQRSGGGPESSGNHPADPRCNEPAEGFWRLSAPCGMHDQGFVYTRTENERRHNGIGPQDRCVECHFAISAAAGSTNSRLNLLCQSLGDTCGFAPMCPVQCLCK